MNVPNLITLSRLVITVVCFVCLESAPREVGEGTSMLTWWAFGLFAVAAATDWVDGHLARKLGQVTQFGRVVDPFADKILVCGTLIILLEFPAATDVMHGWFVVVVVARELLVTTIRGLAEASGIAFPAERIGKYKMFAQCVLAGTLLILAAGADQFRILAVAALWVTLVLTVWSGLDYTWKARRLLSTTS